MSNLPPGVTAGHPYFNPPDHSHEHRWRSEKVENPIFEDGAAIFHDYCEYTEGRYGDGWSCEETRTLRCDVESVTLLRDGKPDVTYLSSAEDNLNEWRFIERLFEEALIGVENGGEDNDLTIDEIHPANKYGDGYVEVSFGKYQVVYSQ